MMQRILALAALAALTFSAPAAAQAPKAAQPKAAQPKAPAAKPPGAKAAPAPTGPFNAQDPASLTALLAALDAKAETARRETDAVLLKVTSPAGGFTAQFAGCNAQGRACRAIQFEATAERSSPTLAQINGFNQSSLTCRITQDRGGKPHVLYSTLLFPGDTRQDMLVQIQAWQGCLGEFGAFLKDPPGYLAVAP
ncbi:YbjN domain-containing protein [Phenylobacterium sp.]|uniref:YbjN domain-containing protein n=1 Tax=Phenylobacterium sp. TaxID=1871053 RepID=UPI0035B0E118